MSLTIRDRPLSAHLARWLYPAIALLAPPIAVLAPLGTAPLLGVAGLGSAMVLAAAGRYWAPRGIPALLFGLLIAFAAASAAWSPAPLDTLARVPRLAMAAIAGGLLVAAAGRVDAATRDRTARALAAGLLLALLPPLADWVRSGLASRETMAVYNRGLSVAVLLVWPAALLLVRRGAVMGAVVGLWAAVMVVVFATVSDSAKLALLFGLVAACLGWTAPRATPLLLAAAAVFYIAAAPVIHGRVIAPQADGMTLESITRDYPLLPRSAYHRLLIWEFTARRIAEKPLLGWGYDGARRLPGGHRRFDIPDEAMPLHPHNAVLQLWVELGAVGAALAAALAVWAGFRLRRTSDRAAVATGSGFYAACFSLLCATFGIWQGWWLSALFLSAALLAASLPRPDD